jgi:hypothetical protein
MRSVDGDAVDEDHGIEADVKILNHILPLKKFNLSQLSFFWSLLSSTFLFLLNFSLRILSFLVEKKLYIFFFYIFLSFQILNLRKRNIRLYTIGLRILLLVTRRHRQQ